MTKITAQMKPDWIEPYKELGENIPVVVKSNHPRYVKGTRLDWGYVQTALDEGYTVEIKPYDNQR